MKCNKCGSENTQILVNVTLEIDVEHIRQLTKKALQSKGVQMLGADWEQGKICCRNCGHVEIGL